MPPGLLLVPVDFGQKQQKSTVATVNVIFLDVWVLWPEKKTRERVYWRTNDQEKRLRNSHSWCLQSKLQEKLALLEEN